MTAGAAVVAGAELVLAGAELAVAAEAVGAGTAADVAAGAAGLPEPELAVGQPRQPAPPPT